MSKIKYDWRTDKGVLSNAALKGALEDNEADFHNVLGCPCPSARVAGFLDGWNAALEAHAAASWKKADYMLAHLDVHDLEEIGLQLTHK